MVPHSTSDCPNSKKKPKKKGAQQMQSKQQPQEQPQIQSLQQPQQPPYFALANPIQTIAQFHMEAPPFPTPISPFIPPPVAETMASSSTMPSLRIMSSSELSQLKSSIPVAEKVANYASDLEKQKLVLETLYNEALKEKEGTTTQLKIKLQELQEKNESLQRSLDSQAQTIKNLDDKIITLQKEIDLITKERDESKGLSALRELVNAYRIEYFNRTGYSPYSSRVSEKELRKNGVPDEEHPIAFVEWAEFKNTLCNKTVSHRWSLDEKTGLLMTSAKEAIDTIEQSTSFDCRDKANAKALVQYLSSKKLFKFK